MRTLKSLLLILALSSCAPDPITGPIGPKGDSIKGDTGGRGPTGSDGAPGRDGIDATPVTIVRLCPATTVYPSTFTEIAFCIGGKLYATYSQNGGFSTEIPPGTYSSNGINSSCAFTVGANCEVTSQ